MSFLKVRSEYLFLKSSNCLVLFELYLYGIPGTIGSQATFNALVPSKNFDFRHIFFLGSFGTVADFSFPGAAPTTNFNLRLSAYLNITTSGTYTFYTSTGLTYFPSFIIEDDGSLLYIDDAIVVNNDGTHPDTEVSGVINLEPGLIPIMVDFFQGTGSRALAVSYQGPGFPLRLCSYLSH